MYVPLPRFCLCPFPTTLCAPVPSCFYSHAPPTVFSTASSLFVSLPHPLHVQLSNPLAMPCPPCMCPCLIPDHVPISPHLCAHALPRVYAPVPPLFASSPPVSMYLPHPSSFPLPQPPAPPLFAPVPPGIYAPCSILCLCPTLATGSGVSSFNLSLTIVPGNNLAEFLV